MALVNQWDECITKLYYKYQCLHQTQSLSRFFLVVLCHRLGMKSVLDKLITVADAADDHIFMDILSAIDGLLLPEIDEVETLYQLFMDRSVRVGTGSFYTPDNLASYMVIESLRTHFQQHVRKETLPYFPIESMLIQSTHHEETSIPADVLRELMDWFESLHILDLSCGSGVFLRRALVVLVQAGMYIYNANGNHKTLHDLIRECMQVKITGIEFQPDTRLLAEVLMKLQIRKICREYNVETMSVERIQPGIHCDNALSWNEQEKDSIVAKKYTLILGNPPYVGEKGNTHLFYEAKKTIFGEKHYEKNMDFSYYFLHRGLDLLAKDGVLCYVSTSYFATADGAKKLRKRLQEQVLFHWLIYPESITLFPHAKGQHNLIYCLSRKESHFITRPVLLHQVKTMKRDSFIISLPALGTSFDTDDQRLTVFENSTKLFDQRGQLLIRSPGKVSHILEKISQLSMYQLQDLCTVNQGVVSGADKMKNKHGKSARFQGVNRGIFVLNREEKEALIRQEPKITKYLKPFFKNSQIEPYFVSGTTNQWLLYITDENMPSIDWSEPLSCHLKPFKPILSQRREVQKGIRRWHSLHWPRKASIFEKEKIVAPQRSALNIFGYSADPWYASADVYFIQRRDICFYSIEYLLLWLNSALCYAWLSYYGKMKGKDLELYATPLKQIPIPEPSSDQGEKWMQNQYRRITGAQGNPELLMELVREVDYQFFRWFEIDIKQASELLTHVDVLRKKMMKKDQ